MKPRLAFKQRVPRTRKESGIRVPRQRHTTRCYRAEGRGVRGLEQPAGYWMRHWRNNSRYHEGCVPTLGRYLNGGVWGRVVCGNSLQEWKVERVVLSKLWRKI